MRFRKGLIFVFFALWIAAGCRKPLAPSVDSNFAPETWITAAPQDTITTRDPSSGAPIQPLPGTLPFRYHLHWAGSDEDGSVAGFYWAVTETSGSVSGLPIPPLPGPKPRDYKYTSATDSVFIFSVIEETNNRQHAFYIYAVDNEGKPDPTPARVLFNTLDRFPPLPVIEPESNAKGFIFRPSDAWRGPPNPLPAARETTILLRDTLGRHAIRDVVPIGSVVRMKWHADMRVANNPAKFFRYKIGEGEEVDFVTVPASVTGTEYNTTDRNRLGPGLKVFTLRAIDQAGGARFPETTRRFYMNLPPDTWLSGPDLNPEPNFYTVERWWNNPTAAVKKRYRQVADWQPATIAAQRFPGSLLNPDSVTIMPAVRPARKTFFELYSEYNFANPAQPRHRIYVHSEGDTVHMNSWVLFHAGGFDADSPYQLRVLINGSALPPLGSTPVMTSSQSANGSAIGFRYRIPVLLDSIGPVRVPGSGTIVTFPQSQVFPMADPAFVTEPHIGAFQGMQASGRAYALLRAQDGNGRLDESISDPVAFVDSVEQGLIGPGHPRYPLRDKVLTFYVNRAPYLNRDPPFEPQPGQVYFNRSITIRIDRVFDDDPYSVTQRSVGGLPFLTPPTLTYRFNVLLRGRLLGSDPPRDTVFSVPGLTRQSFSGPPNPAFVDIPCFIQGPQVAVEIEVCDCRECETSLGLGRCQRYPPINIIVPEFCPEPGVPPASASVTSVGPGSTGASTRSQRP